VAVDGADAAAGLHAQVRDREQPGEVGGLKASRVTAPPWTAPGGPPSPGWTIRAHGGLEAGRRAWERRIGQTGVVRRSDGETPAEATGPDAPPGTQAADVTPPRREIWVGQRDRTGNTTGDGAQGAVEALLEQERRHGVPEQDETRQVIATTAKRMTEAFTRTVGEEMAPATTKGVPTDILLQDALNALLRVSAVVAGNLLSPENAAPHKPQARIDRLRLAFSHVVHRTMEGEIGALERKGHG
jgi:hypothetical protein